MVKVLPENKPGQNVLWMNWILGSDFTVFLLLHHCAIKHYSTLLFIPDRFYALSHTAKLILYQFGWMIRKLFLDLEPLWSVPSVGMVERDRKITMEARKRHILLSLLGLFLLAYYSGRFTMWTPSLGTSLAKVWHCQNTSRGGFVFSSSWRK